MLPCSIASSSPLGCCGQMRIFTLGLSHFQVLHRFLRMLDDYTGMTHVAVLDGFLGMIKRLGDMRADLCHDKLAKWQHANGESEKERNCKQTLSGHNAPPFIYQVHQRFLALYSERDYMPEWYKRSTILT